MKKTVDNSRRDFLAKTAIAGTITLAATALLRHSANASSLNETSTRNDHVPVSNKNRWGILVDTSKCGKGCTACVDACNKENGLVGHGRPETDTQYIRKVSLKDKVTGHELSLPLMCQHCETAPCVDVCPTGASFIRADGIALVDRHICIGCRYCMMACPYKARSFVHEDLDNQKLTAPRGKGTVESCNMCVTRVDAGKIPACVKACSADDHKAMMFGDLNDPNSGISIELKEHGGKQIRSDLALNTAVHYQGLNE